MIFHLLGALLAVGAKLFYRRAGAEELDWILAPTCWLAELASGIEFERERHVGWVSHSARVIVGPSCAGVNFLVIAFVTLFFSFVHRLSGPRAKGLWLAASAGTAYGLAVGANSLRIVATTALHAADAPGRLVPPEQLHRIVGTLVYCVSLWLAHQTVGRLVASQSPPRARGSGFPEPHPRAILQQLVPFGWYVLVTLGLPLANRAGDDFAEHAVVVGSVVLVLAALLVLVHTARSRERKW